MQRMFFKFNFLLEKANAQNQMETALETALKAGYRHFDTSPFSQNEEILGRVLRNWLDGRRLKREELFIVTKVVVPHEKSYLNSSLKILSLRFPFKFFNNSFRHRA